MRVASVNTRVVPIPLARPYTIAFRTVTAIESVIVELHDDQGRMGLGAASPEPYVTGETVAACQAALLGDRLAWLVGRNARVLPALLQDLAAGTTHTPAARAAVDMALHDLWAQDLGLPLVRAFGQVHEALPTSITIGIKDLAATLAEAAEYVGRGFRALKVKTGLSLDGDIERLTRLREAVGPHLLIRVDANQGYTLDETRRFFAATENLNLEFMEQPIKAADTGLMRELDAAKRARLCADEGLLTPEDAARLVAPPHPATGIFNIKLMKCGGIEPARRIADVAESAGVTLMWGCMDESRIAIAAALHTALSSRATRYLDLDGSFDLARDVAEGGFDVQDGMMRPLDRLASACDWSADRVLVARRFSTRGSGPRPPDRASPPRQRSRAT